MYKVMLVDDDRVIRERLRETIPFAELGLELCCEAADGEEAFELYQQNQPHIVITDINIPLKSGLELARDVLAEDGDVGIIIITGYGSLDFAREAIRTGTTAFLLKPIDTDELIAALRSLIERFDERREKFRETQRMERLLAESLPWLREHFLTSLLRGELTETDSDLRQHIRRLGLKLEGGWYCAAVLVPRYREGGVGERAAGQTEREVIQIAVENIVRELVMEKLPCCAQYYDTFSRAIVVVGGKDRGVGDTLERQLSVARDKLRFYFEYDFSAGVGRTVDSLPGLAESFRGATEALGYRNIYGENNIVSIENVLILERLPAVSLREEREQVLERFRAGDEEGLREALMRFMNRVTRETVAPAAAQRIYIELLAAVFSCADDFGLPTDAAAKGEENPYAELVLSADAGFAQRRVLEYCTALARKLRERRTTRAGKLVESAKQFISENLSDPELSLTTVSDHVQLSSIYFCSLFKQETGMNFVDYLNRERVERAKTLLTTTNMKIYEISEAVGYVHSKYFFQIFKKLTGQRPREYAGNR